MQIRVPRRHERNPHRMREPRTKLSELAGTRDVNHVGAKFLEYLPHVRGVAPQEKVVAQIALDAKTRAAPWKLEVAHRTFSPLRQVRSRVNREERAPVSRGEVRKLARGKRDTIDLVKRFAEKCNTRMRAGARRDRLLRDHSPPSSWPRNASRTAGRTCGLTRNAMTQRNLSTSD